MDNKRKVKILNSVYKADLHVFKWTVMEIETGKEFCLVVPLSDVLSISVLKTVDIPDGIITKFCNDMKNKEIFLASKYNDDISEDMKNLEEEKIIEKHKEIDEFPCYEAYKITEEENNDNYKR